MFAVRLIFPILLITNAYSAPQLGVYNWGGAYPHSVAEGVERVAALGGTVVRIALSARTPVDYNAGEHCWSPFSLASGAQTQDLAAALSNPRISTYVITAYDGATFDCAHTFFLDPAFFTPEHTLRVETEYRDFTYFLIRTYAGKRFIIDNWEGDNAVYCGMAYSYATDPSARAECDANYPTWYNGVSSPGDALRGFRLWLQARAAGIEAGRARATAEGIQGGEVLLAAEINIVRALRDRGLQSVLYDVLPGLQLDYVSYSAYESLNGDDPVNTLPSDLTTIKTIVNVPVIIGEFGFSRSQWPDAIGRTDLVLKAAWKWGPDYIIVWNLFDQSATEEFGLFGIDGESTPFSSYYSAYFPNGRSRGPRVPRKNTAQ